MASNHCLVEILQIRRINSKPTVQCSGAVYYAVIRGSAYCILVGKKALRVTNYLKANWNYLSISLFISRYQIGDRF